MGQTNGLRVGFGFDVHRLIEGRPLILGGVNIPFSKGLLGHSDADVLVHAIIDAIIGAMGEGDIGCHFPDTDPQYKNISSLRLLELVCHTIMLPRQAEIMNIDATIIAQAPKLNPYFTEMKNQIAKVLHISPSIINIKAKTTEGLGYIGHSEAMAAYAVVGVEIKK